MEQSKKFKCNDCGKIIPVSLNENTGEIQPSTNNCPNCNSINISVVFEQLIKDNRQILND